MSEVSERSAKNACNCYMQFFIRVILKTKLRRELNTIIPRVVHFSSNQTHLKWALMEQAVNQRLKIGNEIYLA